MEGRVDKGMHQTTGSSGMGLAGVGDGVASVLGLFGVGVAGMLGLFGAAVAFGLGVGVASPPLRLGVDVGVGVGVGVVVEGTLLGKTLYTEI